MPLYIHTHLSPPLIHTYPTLSTYPNRSKSSLTRSTTSSLRNLPTPRHMSPSPLIGWQATGMGFSRRGKRHASATLVCCGSVCVCVCLFGSGVCVCMVVGCVPCTPSPPPLHPHPHWPGVPMELLRSVGDAITTLPSDFHAHKMIRKIYDLRHQMVVSGEGIDWGTAEALAFGTLISEGVCGVWCMCRVYVYICAVYPSSRTQAAHHHMYT